MSDLFKVLGVERDCTTQDVRKAFMTQALKWHPDRAPEDEKEEYTKQYELLQEAYKTLSNDEVRNQYTDAIGNTHSDLKNVKRDAGYSKTTQFCKIDESGKKVFDNAAFMAGFVDKTQDAVDTVTTLHTEKNVTKCDFDAFMQRRNNEMQSISKAKMNTDLHDDPSKFSNAFNAAFERMKKQREEAMGIQEYVYPDASNNLDLTELGSQDALLTSGDMLPTDQLISGMFDNPVSIDLTVSENNEPYVEPVLSDKDIQKRMANAMADRDRLLTLNSSEYQVEATEIEKRYSSLYKPNEDAIAGAIEPCSNAEPEPVSVDNSV